MVRAWRSVPTRVTPMARWEWGVPIALSGLLGFGPRSERVGGAGSMVHVGVHGGWGNGRLEWESGGWRWLAAVLPGRPADLSMVLTWMPSLGWGGRRKCSYWPMVWQLVA